MTEPLGEPDPPAPGQKFPRESLRQRWTEAAERSLKGTLSDAPPPGGLVAPLHDRARGVAPIAGRGPGRAWRIAQRVDHPEPRAANALALADLAGGADALTLVVAGAPTARGFGLATPGDAGKALDGVILDMIALRIEAGARGIEAATAVLAVAKARGHDPATLDISFGHDPIGAHAAGAPLPPGWAGSAGRLVKAVAETGQRGAVLTADGRPYHDAGANPEQELAAIVTTVLAYLRATEAAGHGLAEALPRIDVAAATGQDIFVSIAKLRALRLLIARVGEACGLAPLPIRLHAETSWRMTTRGDPWTDMLRGTLAGFAAGLGGADSVAILPFTTALGLPDGFARRVARNAQHILMAEAHLDRVADPAAGSGAIEALTDRLCFAAWRLVQEIERRGGIVEALASGYLQHSIAETSAAATAEPAIVGTTRYPAPAEAEPVGTLDVLPPAWAEALPGDRLAAPLVPQRLAARFEAMTP